MLTARENMDVVAAFENVGTYRGAAVMCGVDPKTVKRKVDAHRRSALTNQRQRRTRPVRNTEVVRSVVAEKIAETRGKMTAKRLLPIARAAGYSGSARNFRRLVAEVRKAYKITQGRHQRRPAIWVPGATLVIDWGTIAGTDLHVFCAVLAWARVRFIRFSRDEKAATTFAFLAECFEELGGVPASVLADRMGCLKAGTVANVVIPTAEYVRFATHYRFRPDFCHAADPESKGIVENLVGYSKTDFVIPDTDDLTVINAAAARWCAEVNERVHSETCTVPLQRLVVEREVLGSLPSLRPRIGHVELRKVDKLSTVRVASARYSTPHTQVGRHVEVVVFDGQVRIYTSDGDLIAEHRQLGPGEASILDEHYPTNRSHVARGHGPRWNENSWRSAKRRSSSFVTVPPPVSPPWAARSSR